MSVIEPRLNRNDPAIGAIPPFAKGARGISINVIKIGTVIFLIAVFVASCGGAQKVDTGPRGTLRLEGSPKDAGLEIDEVHLGPIHMFEKQGILLRPGEHRIIVRADGYFPEYRIVPIKDGEVFVLKVELRPVPE